MSFLLAKFSKHGDKIVLTSSLTSAKSSILLFATVFFSVGQVQQDPNNLSGKRRSPAQRKPREVKENKDVSKQVSEKGQQQKRRRRKCVQSRASQSREAKLSTTAGSKQVPEGQQSHSKSNSEEPQTENRPEELVESENFRNDAAGDELYADICDDPAVTGAVRQEDTEGAVNVLDGDDETNQVCSQTGDKARVLLGVSASDGLPKTNHLPAV